MKNTLLFLAFILVPFFAQAAPWGINSVQFKRWYAGTQGLIIDDYESPDGSKRIEAYAADLRLATPKEKKLVFQNFLAWLELADAESIHYLTPLNATEVLQQERLRRAGGRSFLNEYWRVIHFSGRSEGLEIAIAGIVRNTSNQRLNSSPHQLTVVVTDTTTGATAAFRTQVSGDQIERPGRQANRFETQIYFPTEANAGLILRTSPSQSSYIILEANRFQGDRTFRSMRLPVTSALDNDQSLANFQQMLERLKQTYFSKFRIGELIAQFVNVNGKMVPSCARIFLEFN